MPSSQFHEVVPVIYARTGGSFDIDRLVGPSRAADRAIIMAAVVGKRVPVAKSGINALRAALYEMAEVGEACFAVQRQSFIDICKKEFSTN